jgi:hypothetical protein
LLFPTESWLSGVCLGFFFSLGVPLIYDTYVM